MNMLMHDQPVECFGLSLKPKRTSRKRSRFVAEHELCVTEYYRQECLLAFYAATSSGASDPKRRPRRAVHFNDMPLVLGVADADVDRSPAPLSQITREEMIVIMNDRVFPHAHRPPMSLASLLHES
ncbi:Aste57867_21059 [Aphanomyces stellatus]|uniref:Aste57867_21059 protein n=1 Tax=Aphanomyces stellatus TaxID=120398 RepID=A0A485LGI3_9STRA|nr:hypothetical protein As57867_020991 [Aphanomyces stellatus]VFT97734.1 Aste57867_21059 [Aphanomyces stellatus]